MKENVLLLYNTLNVSLKSLSRANKIFKKELLTFCGLATTVLSVCNPFLCRLPKKRTEQNKNFSERERVRDMDWAFGIFLAIFVNICECLECYDCVEGNGGVHDCEQTIDCPEGMDVCTLEWDGK